MKWYHELYLSPNLTGSEAYLHWLAERGWSIRPVYLIVLSDMRDGQLEILPLPLLRMFRRMNREYDVIGMAKGYYHARTLAAKIISDVYEQTGGCDAKTFFLEKMRQSFSEAEEGKAKTEQEKGKEL